LLPVEGEGEAQEDLGVVGRAGVDAVAGGDDVTDVEAEHQQLVEEELDAAAEVRRLVDVEAEGAGGADEAAAPDDEGGDPPEGDLADHVGAEVEEGRPVVGLDRPRGHDAALDLAADEREGEVREAGAELRRDRL